MQIGATIALCSIQNYNSSYSINTMSRKLGIFGGLYAAAFTLSSPFLAIDPTLDKLPAENRVKPSPAAEVRAGSFGHTSKTSLLLGKDVKNHYELPPLQQSSRNIWGALTRLSPSDLKL